MLERYALGELPPDQTEAIRAQLVAEAEAVRAGLTPQGDLSDRLEALHASDAELLERHPPRQAANEIRRRLHLRRADSDQAAQQAGRGRRRWLLGLAPVAAAAIALFVVLLPGTSDQIPSDPDDGIIPTTAKGLEPVLKVYQRTGEDSVRLKEGATARRADLLQLAYTASGWEHGVILSIDGRGAVTLHLPTQPAGETELSLDGEVALGFSYELDDAPRYERFFMVTSEMPIDVQAVLLAADQLASSGQAQAGDLPLPASMKQTSVRIDKAKR